MTDTKSKVSIQRVFGILLLIPPALSVLLLLINLIDRNPGAIVELRNLSNNWTGDYGYNSTGGGGGYTSAAPIYFGLMAIAGAILLRDRRSIVD